MINKNISDKHLRKKLRLVGYDYSNPGLYFITICSQNHVCIFGEIQNNVMILNDAGIMVEKWFCELENKFEDIKCCERVVMPNHFHCIIENKNTNDAGESSSLTEIMQWFKTMTTNEYIRGVKKLGWQPFDGKLWQRSYWDHIIPDQNSYERICEYIYCNPLNWKDDQLYK